MNIKSIVQRLRHFGRSGKAVSALEYAILVGVVVVAIGTALATFSDNITAALNTVAGQITPGLVGGGGTP